MYHAHSGIENKPVTCIDEKQGFHLLGEQVVGANRREDEAQCNAKGCHHFGLECQCLSIAGECMGQSPRGQETEGESTAADKWHIAGIDVLFGKSDGTHPALTRQRSVPDPSDNKSH